MSSPGQARGARRRTRALRAVRTPEAEAGRLRLLKQRLRDIGRPSCPDANPDWDARYDPEEWADTIDSLSER